MPAALPLIAGAFLAGGAIATAVGLTTAFVVAGLAISWAAVLTITGVALLAVAYLARKTPKPDSGGQQLKQKLDPQAPVPILYGRSATGGFITWRGTWGAKNAFYGIVTVLSAGGPIAGVEAYQAGDYPIGFGGSPAYSLATVNNVGGYSGSSKLYKGKLAQRWQNGDAPASTTPGGASGLPIPAGAMSGLAHVITRYEFNNDAFPQGLPSSLWTASGVKLYDPRKDSTYPGGSGGHRVDQPSTWAFSENPFLAALQWTLGRYENGRRVYGIGAKWTEVDVASFVTGANVADANNWKVGGVVTTTDDKYAVLASILAAGGGVPVARGAQIACTVNAPKTSVLTLTKEDIVGEVETSSTTSWRDRQNTIIPKYREETQGWEIVAGEQITSAQFIGEDGGEQKTVEVEFPLVQQAAQAHQLATYELCNSREFLTVNVNAKLRLLAVRVGDAITVAVPQIGARSLKCTVTGREFNPSDSTVTLSLKSETDAKHAFALGQSQVAPPAPKLDGYDPSNPGAPAANAWAITATQIATTDTTLPVIVVTGATDDPNTSTVIVEYRPSGSSAWLNYGEFPRTTTKVEVSGLTDGTAYDVALSYRTVLGVVGERLVLNATAGAFKVSWSSTVAGAGKPANNADVTKDNTSKDTAAVAGTPASTVRDNASTAIGAVKDRNGNVTNIQVVIDSVAAETSRATTALSNERASINSDIATAKADAAKVRTDLASEVARAMGDEAAIRTSVTNLKSTVDGHTTTISDNYTTLTNADVALVNRANTIEAQLRGDASSNILAKITDNATVAANATQAVGNRLNTVEANYQTAAQVDGRATTIANAKVADEATLRSNADGALGTRLNTIETSYQTAAQVDSRATVIANSKVADEATLRSNADGALGTRLNTVEANYQTAAQVDGRATTIANAKVADEASARSTAIQALSTRANTIEANYNMVSAGVVPNDRFANWPDGQRNPTAWTDWNTEGNYTISRTTGVGGSRYAVYTTHNANAECGFYQYVTTWPGKWTVEVTARRDGGSLSGSGVTLSGIYSLDFIGDPDTNGRVGDSSDGETRTWTKQFDITQNSLALHAMAGWNGFNRPRASNYITWFKVTFRPSGPGDIAGVANAADITAAKARISNVETAVADGRFASAQRASNIEASLNGVSGRVSTVETATSDGRFAAASRVNTLEATTVKKGFLNNNPFFTQSGWNSQSSPPPGWAYWSQDGSPYMGWYTVTAPSNYGAPYALQIDRQGNNCGVYHTIYGQYPKGYYVMEADVRLEDGNVLGSGMHVNFNTGSSAQIDFYRDPDSNGDYGDHRRNRSFSKLVRNDYETDRMHFYLMAGWTGFNNYTGFLRTIWQKAGIRPATKQEIDSGKVDTLTARVTTTEGAVSNLNGRTAAYWQVTADAGNGRGQLAVRADGYGGGVDIVGDVAIRGQNGNGRSVITSSGMNVYDANGTLRVRLGLF